MTILRFLKSFSLVFVRAEMKNPELIIISSKTILFPRSYHELNLSRLWGIPRGKNVNWKIARKCDICILKYWLFPKAFRELQIKWNGSVLNLNHSSIPQTKICQTDTSLLSFALFMSKIHLPLLGALISANLRLPTLASANFLCFLYFEVQL